MVALFGAGCGGRGPEVDLMQVFEALGDPTEPVADLSMALLRVLDTPSRQAIETRAAKLGAEAGVAVDAARVLQTRGLIGHRRVARFEVEATSEDTAKVIVELAPLAPAPAEGTAEHGSTGETLELDARMEDGAWKVNLTDLASLVGRVSIVADGKGQR